MHDAVNLKPPRGICSNENDTGDGRYYCASNNPMSLTLSKFLNPNDTCFIRASYGWISVFTGLFGVKSSSIPCYGYGPLIRRRRSFPRLTMFALIMTNDRPSRVTFLLRNPDFSTWCNHQSTRCLDKVGHTGKWELGKCAKTQEFLRSSEFAICGENLCNCR